MERVYYKLIKHHLDNWNQMVFIEGARQSGKTTLAKRLLLDYKIKAYLNYDNLNDRQLILSGQSLIKNLNLLDILTEEKPLIILDEIHKLPNWKNYLKGLYDTYKDKVKILATGSAKLTLYKKSQDSLMGRYFPYTIYPLSLGEVVNVSNNTQESIKQPNKISDEEYNNLYNYGGFPDPYFKANDRFHSRWQKLRFEQLFRDDILKTEDIRNISQLEVLAHILLAQSTNQINYSSLSKKIQVTDHTVRKWINCLESFYFGFCVYPWHQNVTRSIIKEPKFYLSDWSSITDQGAKAENFIACHLKKSIRFWTDSGIGEFELYYLRTKDKKEVDFLVVKNSKPWFLVEVKYSMNQPINPHLFYFQEQIKAEHAFQVIINMDYVDKDCFKQFSPIKVPAKTFLSQLI